MLYTHDGNRIIAFQRTDGAEQFLVIASLNNEGFPSGHWLDSASFNGERYREIFNSDPFYYGGSNIGNCGEVLAADGDRFCPVVPPNGFVVLQRLSV